MVPFLLIGHRFHEGLGGIRTLATDPSLSEAHQPLQQQQQTSPAMLTPPSLDAAGRLAFPQCAQRFWRGRQPRLTIPLI
jgi:hypothetical protein